MLVVFIIGLFGYGTVSSVRADSGFPNMFGNPATLPIVFDSNVAIGPGVSTRIVASSTARLFLQITEASSTVPVFCNLSDVPATSGPGIVLSTSSPTFVINPLDLYVGSIQCISSASTSISIAAAQ